jgi:hypothetical protein
MKYIQVFESWLNEAEEAKFDPNKPQSYPMLKMTQGQLYSGNEDAFRKSLASLYSRSLEKKETSESDPYSVVNVFAIKIKGVDSKKNTMSFKFAKAQQDVSITTEFKVTASFTNFMDEMGYDIKSEAGLEKIKNAFLIYPKATDKSKVITKSEDGSIKVSTESAIILILPSEAYDEADLAINLDSMCIAKGQARDCVIGQSCSYASLGFNLTAPLGASEYGDDKYFKEKVFKKA